MRSAEFDATRRTLVAAGSAGLVCVAAPGLALAADADNGREKKVSATEDMMREHGILRRALLVYVETAPRLRREPGKIDPGALNDTARLFRSFGEDYHERKLEEQHVFPAMRNASGSLAALVGVLTLQHQRGREITDYILNSTSKGRIGNAAPLAQVLDRFALMYQNHAAREDTVLFPAWKNALSARQFDEMGELFENIERRQFGHDGFEDAAKKIADIEGRLGYADLARFTPPPPPRS